MRWSVYFVAPKHQLLPLGRVNAPDHLTALVRTAEKWGHLCDFSKPHLGMEVRKWKNDPHPLGKRYEAPFSLDEDAEARKAAYAVTTLRRKGVGRWMTI